MYKLFQVTLALTIVAALVACSAICPTPAPVAPVVKVINDSCKWIKPMTASASDTLITRQEIDGYDRAYAANCKGAK